MPHVLVGVTRMKCAGAPSIHGSSPGADHRRAFGLGIQMMRRSAHQHDPSLARLQVELVRLHGDLILGVRDTGAQVFVKQRGVPRAQTTDSPSILYTVGSAVGPYRLL